MKKEICHVCRKEKKPYIVVIKNDIFSLIQYKQSREDGAICERCDRFFAMTGEFKDATEEEFKIAKKSSWFANMMLKWWEKDGKMSENTDDKREWEGTSLIASWCRNALPSNSSSEKFESSNKSLSGESKDSPKSCPKCGNEGIKKGDGFRCFTCSHRWI